MRRPVTPGAVFKCANVDNVSQAVEISGQLEKRSDIDRMVDKIKTVI